MEKIDTPQLLEELFFSKKALLAITAVLIASLVLMSANIYEGIRIGVQVFGTSVGAYIVIRLLKYRQITGFHVIIFALLQALVMTYMSRSKDAADVADIKQSVWSWVSENQSADRYQDFKAPDRRWSKKGSEALEFANALTSEVGKVVRQHQDAALSAQSNFAAKAQLLDEVYNFRFLKRDQGIIRVKANISEVRAALDSFKKEDMSIVEGMFRAMESVIQKTKGLPERVGNKTTRNGEAMKKVYENYFDSLYDLLDNLGVYAELLTKLQTNGDLKIVNGGVRIESQPGQEEMRKLDQRLSDIIKRRDKFQGKLEFAMSDKWQKLDIDEQYETLVSE